MEKLLRCVPDIGRILVLIRPMRGKSAEERLRSVFTSKVSSLSCVAFEVLVVVICSCCLLLFVVEAL